MIKLAVLALLLSTSVVYAGEQYNFYNKQGMRTGDVKQDGNRWVSHDNMGRTTGWTQRDGNQIKQYNSMGIYQGSIRAK